MAPDRSSSEQRDEGPLQAYARGVRASLGNNAAAYAYSLMITATFGVVTSSLGPSRVIDVFLFALGAATSFALIEGVASRGFRVRMRGEPPEVVVLGSAMSFPSVLLAVGGAALISPALGPGWEWAVGSFASTSLFLMLASLEMLIAERLRRTRGVEDVEE